MASFQTTIREIIADPKSSQINLFLPTHAEKAIDELLQAAREEVFIYSHDFSPVMYWFNTLDLLSRMCAQTRIMIGDGFPERRMGHPDMKDLLAKTGELECRFLPGFDFSDGLATVQDLIVTDNQNMITWQREGANDPDGILITHNPLRAASGGEILKELWPRAKPYRPGPRGTPAPPADLHAGQAA